MASQAITQLEIGNRLSEAFFTGGHVRMFPLCFLINVADGYDMVSMAYAAPAILHCCGVSQENNLERGMKSTHVALVTVFFTSVLYGTAVAEATDDCRPENGLQFICGPENAEDLVHVKGTPWVVTSGEGLYLVNIESKSWQKLSISYPASSDNISPPYDMCPSALTPGERYAHGITIRFHESGVHELYVVNHEERRIS